MIDFAADIRAPTPTAAAELVSPSLEALRERIAETALRLSRQTARALETAMQTVDALARRLVHPAERLLGLRQNLSHLAKRLSSATARLLEGFTAQVKVAHKSLVSLDPNAVLGRGFSITRDAGGALLRDASKVSEGERITTTLARGSIESEILKKQR